VKRLHDLQTPALLVDADDLDHNLRTMSEALPGARLRPPVTAHKCTSLARRQVAAGRRRGGSSASRIRR
jgi:D-serine deaminase-like pyridoxal phosphate-dependent protein